MGTLLIVGNSIPKSAKCIHSAAKGLGFIGYWGLGFRALGCGVEGFRV